MMGNGMPSVAKTEFSWLRKGLIRQVGDFRRNEDGSLLIFGLFCFVMMLILAGVSLDLMRYEERRTTLQNTTDRAVLAAADLRQTLAPKDVVKDYFKKAGLPPPKDSDIIVNQGTFSEWRTVQANTSEVMPTWFMNMLGVKTLTPISSGTAEERIGNVEISLVLDVSGSMNSNNRLTNLKPAAKAFVDQMFDTVEAGKLSMSIISYSAQASAGPDLIKYFATKVDNVNTTNSGDPTVATCIEFASGDFSSTALVPKSTPVGMPPGPLDTRYKLNGLFDPFYTAMVNTGTTTSSLTHCPPNLDTSSGSANKNNNRNIMAFSGDRAALKAKVDALVASGNTSIDIGVKWGAGLLDPSMAPVVTSMIAEGKVNAQFGGRPLAYKKASGQWNDEVLKVIVVMTDGENTTEYKLRDNYNFGNSLLVRNNTTKYSANDIKRYSLWDQSRGKYWIFATSAWRTTAWGSNPTDIPTDNSDQALNLSWPDVWALMSVNYFADNIIGPVYGSTERNKWRTGTTTKATTYIDSQKDSQTLAICSAAKANNIKVYTIGFEAPTAGQTLLKSCASSPSQFYSVAGLDIKKAFSSIASSINKLRLTH
jgi:uncharacterized protein YegL